MRDPADLFEAGARAAEDILHRAFRIDIAKDDNPLGKRSFVVLVRRVSRRLLRVAGPHDARGAKAAAEKLDADWPNLTAKARGRLIDEADESVAAAGERALPALDAYLETASTQIVGGTRRAAKKSYKLSIAASLTDRDERTAEHVRASHTMFIRDAHGDLRERLSAKARDIVADGLEKGLGREDISEGLAAAMTGAKRPDSYWDLIATNFSNRARTFTHVHALDEAGIEAYRFDAVLDEATSEICRFMHGKVFNVGKAVKRQQRVIELEDPEEIKVAMPWVSKAKRDADGKEVLYYETEGGARRAVAVVDEPAEGKKDEVGSYSRELSTEQLERAGVTSPPLHGNCRSSLTPVF